MPVSQERDRAQTIAASRADMTRNLVGDILKYFPSLVLPSLTALITVPIYTRLFAPEVYGNYALTLAAVGMLSAASSGFAAVLMRFLPAQESRDAASRFLSTLVFITGICTGIIATLASMALWLSASKWEQDLLSLMRIGVILYLLDVAFLMLATFLQSWRKIGTYSTLRLLRAYGALGLGLLLVLVLNRGVEGLLWGAIIVTGIISLPGWLWIVRRYTINRHHFRRELVSSLGRFAFFVSAGNVVYWLLSLSDRWLLGLLRDTSEVGIYAVSYDISGRTLQLALSAFLMAVQPLVTSIWELQGRSSAEEFIGVTTRWYLLLVLPMAVGLSVLAKPAVEFIASPRYWSGYVIVPFVAASMFFYGLAEIVGRGFVLNNRPAIETRNYFLAGALNVVLNLWLIPRWGYVAAGLTTCVGYIILLVLNTWSVRPYLRWHFPYRSCINVVICSTVMALVVVWMGSTQANINALWRLLTGFAIGLMTYIVGLLVLGEISDEVRALVQRLG